MKTITAYEIEIDHECAGTYSRKFDASRDGAQAQRDLAIYVEESDRWGRMYRVTTYYSDGSRVTR